LVAFFHTGVHSGQQKFHYLLCLHFHSIAL
jgi:hypothetical protein